MRPPVRISGRRRPPRPPPSRSSAIPFTTAQPTPSSSGTAPARPGGFFYTNRRADLDDNSGVTWVHGTRIGIAESCDGGAHWTYLGEADIPVAAPDYTLWAPEVIDVDGTYHMFLTVVPGTFTDWNHPRHIQHLTSTDLLHWKPLEDANLESDRTIDACIFRLPTGAWRLWYKNEADSSKVYFSDSPDLAHWAPKGIATTNHGEGPVVFQWHGHYWLINDPHAGLAVFRSDDLTTWTQQPDNILREPGTNPPTAPWATTPTSSSMPPAAPGSSTSPSRAARTPAPIPAATLATPSSMSPSCMSRTASSLSTATHPRPSTCSRRPRTRRATSPPRGENRVPHISPLRCGLSPLPLPGAPQLALSPSKGLALEMWVFATILARRCASAL